MKKLFSVLAVVLFMSNSYSSNKVFYSYDDCFTSAAVAEWVAIYWGFSSAEAYEMGNNAFDSCIDRKNIEAAQEFSN